MHEVRIVGVKTLESGKFNGDTGEMENPCKGTVKWDKSIPLTQAGAYNNSVCIIMSKEEYENLTSGQSYLVPEPIVRGLKTMATMTLDLLKEAEGVRTNDL